MSILHQLRPARRRSALVAALVLVGAAAWFVARHEDPDRLAARVAEAIELGRPDRAERLLDRLSRLRGPTPGDWVLRAQVAFANDRHDEALRAIGHMPDDHPMARWAHYRAGQVELRRHRLRAAEGYFLHALALDPSLVEVRRELLYIYGIQNRPDAIEAQFRALDDLTALGFRDVWYWCIARDNLRWEVEENREALSEVLRADPGDRWARLAMAEVLLLKGAPPDRVRDLLGPLADAPEAIDLRARMELERGDFEAADRLLARGPADNASLALLRGGLALERDGPEAAIPHYRRAHELDPHRREAIVALGQSLSVAGRPDEARPFLEQARAIDVLSGLLNRAVTPSGRRDPRLLHKLGEACLDAGRLHEAAAWYDLALARDPFDTEVQGKLAQIGGMIEAGAPGEPASE